MTWKVQVGTKHGGQADIRTFESEGQARAFRDDWSGKLATGNTNGLADLSSLQRAEVIAALAKLQAYNATLAEAVEFFLKHARPEHGKIAVEAAVDLFLKAKQELKRRPAYLRSLKKTYLPPFAKHFAAKVVTDINQRDAEAYLNKHASWSSSTKTSHITYLSTFYNFLINQGYAKLNPFKNIEKPKAQTTAPKTIAPEDVKQLLQFALDKNYKAECAAMVLVFFCGLRVEEVERLDWKDVILTGDKPKVIVAEQNSKTGHRRVNAIPPNAVHWLTLCRAVNSIAPSDYLQRMKRLRKKSGVTYKQNAMRHCFASYHICSSGDATKTAFLLGHPNPTMLYTQYYSLVNKKDSDTYWNILPDSVSKEMASAKKRLLEQEDQASREAAEQQSNVNEAVLFDGAWVPVQKYADTPPPFQK